MLGNWILLAGYPSDVWRMAKQGVHGPSLETSEGTGTQLTSREMASNSRTLRLGSICHQDRQSPGIAARVTHSKGSPLFGERSVSEVHVARSDDGRGGGIEPLGENLLAQPDCVARPLLITPDRSQSDRRRAIEARRQHFFVLGRCLNELAAIPIKGRERDARCLAREQLERAAKECFGSARPSVVASFNARLARARRVGLGGGGGLIRGLGFQLCHSVGGNDVAGVNFQGCLPEA